MSSKQRADETTMHPHSDWLNLHQLLLAMQNVASETFDDSPFSVADAAASGDADAETAVQRRLLAELGREFPEVDAAAVAADCDPTVVRRELFGDDSNAAGSGNQTPSATLLNFVGAASLRGEFAQSPLATLRNLRHSACHRVVGQSNSTAADFAEPLSLRSSLLTQLTAERLPAIELLCAAGRASLPPKPVNAIRPSGDGELLVTVKVYSPLPDIGGRSFQRTVSQTLRCSQIIMLRGSDTLADLKDRICCRQDEVIVGEVSDILQLDNPRQAMSERCSRSREVYTSSMFFIGLGLYDDCRLPMNRRLSAAVLKWLSENKSARQVFGDSLTAQAMETTRISSLTLRLGEIYLYQHAGSCEHCLVFADASLRHPADPPSLPLAKQLGGHTAASFAYRECRLCMSARAELLIANCDELFDETMCACIDCARIALLNADGSKRVPFHAWCI